MYKSVFRSNMEQEIDSKLQNMVTEDEFEYVEEDGDGPGLGTLALAAGGLAGGAFLGKKYLNKKAMENLAKGFVAGKASKKSKLGRGLVGGGLLGGAGATKAMYSAMSPEGKAAFVGKLKNTLGEDGVGGVAYKGLKKGNDALDWVGDKIGGAVDTVSGLF